MYEEEEVEIYLISPVIKLSSDCIKLLRFKYYNYS